MSTSALKSVLHLKKTPMGAALSFLGFASSTLINAKCENISCCTSVAAVQPPVVRRTGGFLKKRMTTIDVDSRKKVAGSDFEVDLGAKAAPKTAPPKAPAKALPAEAPVKAHKRAAARPAAVRLRPATTGASTGVKA